MKFRYEKETEQLVVAEASRVEYHQMQLWLTRKVKGWKFHPAVKIGVWDGNMTFFKNGRISLGLWKEAMRGCKEIEMPFQLENQRRNAREGIRLLQGILQDAQSKERRRMDSFHAIRPPDRVRLQDTQEQILHGRSSHIWRKVPHHIDSDVLYAAKHKG